MTWYKTGTVAVTPGSNAVIGTGTAFIANSRVGDAFRGPDGEWYEVTNIASDTALSIAPPYQGATVSDGLYSLAPMQGYVKDSADALRAATQVIASGVTDMKEQVAAATEAATSAGQSKAVATEQAGIATAAAEASTDNKDAAQLAAQQSQASAQASSVAAVRSEEARDSIIQSERAAAASAAAAADSAEHAEEVTLGKAASGKNNDITSLMALTADGFDRIRQGVAPFVGAAASVSGTKGLVPAPGVLGANPKFLSDDGTFKEAAGGGGLAVGTLTQWKYSRATIPGGQLPCDGQIVTNGRALYPDLWALIQPFCVTDAVWLAAPYTSRGMFSLGDGSTNFRMPDDNAKHADGNTIAAMVFRGDGKNSAGTPGLHQADQLQGHTLGRNADRLNIYETFYPAGDTAANTRKGAYFNSGNIVPPDYFAIPVTDGTNGTPRIGSETRGPSTTGIWCIVAAKTAVNPGTVDVTVLANTVTGQGVSIADIQSKQVFTKETVLGPLALPVAGGDTIYTHNIGSIPKMCRIYLRYKSAYNGMAVGEEQFIGEIQVFSGTSGSWNCTPQRATTTTIQIRTGTAGIYGYNPAGAASVTTSQADLILRLYT